MSAFFVSPATIDAIVYTRQLAQRAQGLSISPDERAVYVDRAHGKAS